jgi:hypothetical protein
MENALAIRAACNLDLTQCLRSFEMVSRITYTYYISI